jgi:tetratricopeptide (TPR) repeat protein
MRTSGAQEEVGRSRPDARPVLLAVCLVLEAEAGALVLSSPASPSSVLAGLGLHLGACVLFGYTSSRARSGPPDRSRGLLAAVVALLGFPAFGMLAMLSGFLAAAAPLASKPRRSRPRAAPNFAAGSATDLVAHARAMPPDLAGVLGVEPLVDVLSGDDPDLKRGAIDALVRSQGYRAASVLRPLLRDPDSEIRLYASVTLGKLEDDIGQALQAARAATGGAAADATVWQQLAWLYVEYATCGFLAQPSASHHLELAHEAYEAARRLQPDQSELALGLARAHLLLGQLDRVEEYLQPAVLERPNAPDGHLALMELAYRRGALVAVAQRAATATWLVAGDYPQRALVRWWAGAA